jgi:formate hydrogenlyase subunit 4
MQLSLDALVLGSVNVVLALVLSPLFEGILRKVTARIQSRQGPPLLQPYFDLFKLLGKEDIESGQSPVMQRFAAYLSLATALFVAVLIPMGGQTPFNANSDVILLIYFLTLSGIATLLAGLAAGSTYSLVGVSREMMAMLTLEPLLAVAIVVGAVHTGTLRLDGVLNGSVYSAESFPLAGLMMLGIVLFALQAFVGRMPFDTSEAETEIMEGPVMEYSGPKLALFKYARMVKLFVYCTLFVALFIPWGQTGFYPLDVIVLLVKVSVLVLLVTLVAATHARYRIDQVIRYYAGLFGLALLALVFAVSGW